MQDLEKVKEVLEKIEVPHEKLAQGRKQAYQSILTEKKRKHEWRYRLVLAALCMAIAVMVIRFVPTMTDTAKQIQGLGAIDDDQVGPKEFFERLAITEKKNDLTFTLEGVAVEAKYMRIDYIIEAPYDISKLEPSKVEIFQNGEQLIGSKEYGWFDKESSKRITDKIEVYINAGTIASYENFEMHIAFSDEQQTTFDIPFSLKKPLPEMPQYKVNQTLNIEGQEFTIKEVIVSPLHTVIQFTTSPKNDMTLYSIGRIALLNEQEKEWATSENSPVAFGGLEDGEWMVFLKNNFSKIPEKMTLVLEDLNALLKGEDYIVVDFNKKKVLEQPTAIKQKFEVGNGEVHYSIPQGEKLYMGVAVDATGKEWTNTGQTMGEGENGRNYTYSFDSMPNPVKLYFYDYPNPLRFKEEILIYE
jgi:hypothetical protein